MIVTVREGAVTTSTMTTTIVTVRDDQHEDCRDCYREGGRRDDQHDDRRDCHREGGW